MFKSEFIARHQVTAFFGIAFAISWTIWSVSSIVSAGDRNAKLVIDLIGAYGPDTAKKLLQLVEPLPPTRTRRITATIQTAAHNP